MWGKRQKDPKAGGSPALCCSLPSLGQLRLLRKGASSSNPRLTPAGVELLGQQRPKVMLPPGAELIACAVTWRVQSEPPV